MKNLPTVALIAMSSSLCFGADLPRSSPEAQGVSSSAVLSFIQAADKTSTRCTASCSLRHGHVVAEGWWSPYNAESPHSLYSLSKSFTSTAVGLAIAEGKLSLDDEVLKFFPDEAPSNPSSNLKAMRVSDLLRMSTGHQTEPPRPTDQPWTKAFLAHPVPFKPGTHFLYNTSGTYMLSAIVQKATGADRSRLSAAASVRAAGHRAPDLGDQPARHHRRRLRPERSHRGHRPLRPALPAKGQMAGQAACARGLGRGGHRPPDLQRQQSQQRLGPGLWLSVLALPSRHLSGRRRLRPVLHRTARAGCGDRHHQRRERHAGRAELDLGQAAAGPEARRLLLPTMPPGANSNRRSRGCRCVRRKAPARPRRSWAESTYLRPIHPSWKRSLWKATEKTAP